jgi:hypothetical protein
LVFSILLCVGKASEIMNWKSWISNKKSCIWFHIKFCKFFQVNWRVRWGIISFWGNQICWFLVEIFGFDSQVNHNLINWFLSSWNFSGFLVVIKSLEALQCGPSTDSEKRYFGRKPIGSLERFKRAIFQECGPRTDLGWP